MTIGYCERHKQPYSEETPCPFCAVGGVDSITHPQCVSNDKRGWIYMMKLPDGREAILIFTRKGYLRGGEFHKSPQHDVILSGKLKWTFFFRYHETKVQEAGGMPWVILPGYHHMAEALEDTLYVEQLDGQFEKVFVPELRKLVEERMKE